MFPTWVANGPQSRLFSSFWYNKICKHGTCHLSVNHFNSWLFYFYFLHCPSSLIWKGRSWASEFYYNVLVRGSFFFLSKKKKMNPMGLPALLLPFLLCCLMFQLLRQDCSLVGSAQHILVVLWIALHHTGFPGGSSWHVMRNKSLVSNES